MENIINAAPMVIDQGIWDRSPRTVPRGNTNIPQHLPLLYGFFEKGPIGRHYQDHGESSVTQVYGDASFDVNDKYFTHQTPFINVTVSAGNNLVIHRLVAPDATDVANVALYLDVLEEEVPLYEKDADGSLVLDNDGLPVKAKDSDQNPITVTGYKVAWVTESVSVPVGEYQRGELTIRPGIQSNLAGDSIQYPIFEFAAKDVGEAGNKLAVRIHAALESDLVPFPAQLLVEGKNYPYYFSMRKLVDPVTGITSDVLNTMGSSSVTFAAEPAAIDPVSGAVVDLAKVTRDLYIDAPVHLASGLGTAYTYTNNLATVLGMFYNSEKNITDAFKDDEINNVESNLYAVNIISFVNSNGSPYQSVKVEDVTGSIRLTRNTSIFLGGASDGSISESLMDTLVAADLENYNNSLHEYNDLVIHPESIIYDSGFSLATKKVFPKFISRRKDTFVALSTYAHNATYVTLDQQYSIGTALKTMLELYPESVTFGTSVKRGILVLGSGELINSLYTKRVPVLYEVLYKAARFMGAANGAWKAGYEFDRAPGSIITQLKNIDVTWVPTSTRNTLWSVGLNFVLNYSVRSQFFPALQTVNEDDTSVLNSFFTAIAASYLNKVAHSAWREFSGSMSLTSGQLVEALNSYVEAQVKDKFNEMFVIQPDAHVTELDELRGYSFTIPIKLYANNMRTVATVRTETYRMSDL